MLLRGVAEGRRAGGAWPVAGGAKACQDNKTHLWHKVRPSKHSRVVGVKEACCLEKRVSQGLFRWHKGWAAPAAVRQWWGLDSALRSRSPPSTCR